MQFNSEYYLYVFVVIINYAIFFPLGAEKAAQLLKMFLNLTAMPAYLKPSKLMTFKTKFKEIMDSLMEEINLLFFKLAKFKTTLIPSLLLCWRISAGKDLYKTFDQTETFFRYGKSGFFSVKLQLQLTDCGQNNLM